MTTPRTAIRVERNIERRSGSAFRVVVYRRNPNHSGDKIYIQSPTFPDLESARTCRDSIESQYPARPPGLPASGKPRRTISHLRAERRAAGLCYCCGDDPATPGGGLCDMCRWVQTQKRKAKALDIPSEPTP